MADNNKINTTELSFDGIKSSLREYLKGQTQFLDYDFEGSGLSTLLDILAYNTHYNALYHNLAINESFIDSASKRSSVVSRAKELGYIPKSAKSSTAVVNLVLTNSNVDAPDAIEIPKNSPFIATIGSKNYTFYSTADKIGYKSGTQYALNGITIKEGTLLTYSYTYSDGLEIIIPNLNVDTTTLTVTVQANQSSTDTVIYSNSSTIINASGSSTIYFLSETDEGYIKLQFGDGKVGKQLAIGNVITIEYIVCNTTSPNGARTFTYNGSLPSGTTSYVTTRTKAYGGAEPETIESVRWNAPKFYTSQNRCVTAGDYSSVIRAYFSCKAVNVWGGEIEIPPQYGKVYISVVPNDYSYLSTEDKSYIINSIVNPRKSMAVSAEIVDPEYLNIGLTVNYYYDPNKTTRSSGSINTLVKNTIINYNDTKLKNFNDVFKHSNLSTLIDKTELSIKSNIINVKLYKEIEPIFQVASGYDIKLDNPIHYSETSTDSVISNGFYTPLVDNVCYFDDVRIPRTTRGYIRLFYRDKRNEKITIQNIGYVYYTTGRIVINDLVINSLYGSNLEMTIIPSSNDVKSTRNQFVTIDFNRLVINPIIDNTSSYKFSASR